MAVGKNKRLSKKGKGAKKRLGDPFLKKDWYDVKAPANFKTRNVGKTLVSKTQGTKIASDGLKGRVFEVNLADLMPGGDFAYRKIKLKCEEVQGNACLTSFHGMDLTRDHLSHLIRKKQSLIEAHVDVKTTDGYILRMFCIAFTKRDKSQKDNPVATAYAQTAQIRQIRKKMVEIMTRESVTCDLKELVNKFILKLMSDEITKSCKSIYPLQDVYIRKVKILRSPKFDISKLMDMHGGFEAAVEVMEDVGEKVERPAEPIPGAEEESENTAATN